MVKRRGIGDKLEKGTRKRVSARRAGPTRGMGNSLGPDEGVVSRYGRRGKGRAGPGVSEGDASVDAGLRRGQARDRRQKGQGGTAQRRRRLGPAGSGAPFCGSASRPRPRGRGLAGTWQPHCGLGATTRGSSWGGRQTQDARYGVADDDVDCWWRSGSRAVSWRVGPDQLSMQQAGSADG